MSLVSMCQRVTSVCGWPSYATIATNSESTAQQLFGLANEELYALSTLFDWMELETEVIVPTVPGQFRYLWPTDYRVMVQQSLFDATQYYELKGSRTIQDWHYLKNGLLGNLTRTSFRQFNSALGYGFDITPTPTVAQSLVGVYQSKEYARTSGGASIPQYVADTDVSKIPEALVQLGIMWRFRRAKGLDFSVELAQYNAIIPSQFAKGKSSGEIPVGGRRIYDDYPLTQGYIRETGFGA